MSQYFTTLANFKLYQKVDTSARDTLLTRLIQQVSRGIEQECRPNQFGYAAYTNTAFGAVIGLDGVMACQTNTPTVEEVTAAAYKAGNEPPSAWHTIDLSILETEPFPNGCLVRAISNYFNQRDSRRLKMQLTFTGGWHAYTDVAAGTQDAGFNLPDDFELLCSRIVSWEFLKPDTAQDKTAMPSLGQIIIPGNWPADIKQKLRSYRPSFR